MYTYLAIPAHVVRNIEICVCLRTGKLPTKWQLLQGKHDEHNGAISGKPMRGFPGALPKLVMFRKTAILSWDGKNCPTQSMMPYGHCVSVDVQIFDDLCGGQPSGQHLLS